MSKNKGYRTRLRRLRHLRNRDKAKKVLTHGEKSRFLKALTNFYKRWIS